MSGDVVIHAENVGKTYRIGDQLAGDTYVTLGEVVTSGARRLARNAVELSRGRRMPPSAPGAELWALKNIHFEIKRGEAVGIIGRNGAGKSTLLKILSRITEPCTGRVTIRGRVSSLLEVGTGFHPELTGRENIFLNGAILGMTRAEVRGKFDEIVNFSEIERFLDTPVKRYSSGMHVRLAFAVAAHLEPEILIVDEVLAVGDGSFQKKCLGKISAAARGGRTVLFVSHNMAAVAALCQTGLLLANGQIVSRGRIGDVLEDYRKTGGGGAAFRRMAPAARPLALVEASVDVLTWDPATDGAAMKIMLTLVSDRAMRVGVDVQLHDGAGTPAAFGSLGAFDPGTMIAVPAGESRHRISVPVQRLASGTYALSLALTRPPVEIFDRVENCASVTIEPMPGRGAFSRLSQVSGLGTMMLDLAVE